MKMSNKINIGALISGGGTNLQTIIDSCEFGKIDGKMVFVGSDNPEARGLERGKKHKLHTFVVDYKMIIHRYKDEPEDAKLPEDFSLDEILLKQTLFSAEIDTKRLKQYFITRAIAEAKLLDEIKKYPIDLLVLAGCMRNLTPYFIDRFNTGPNCPRIMNIHPALLPSFPGVDGYGDTFRYGAKVGGCTVHFIDYGEDSGPIIGQKVFEIKEGETLEQIKEKGLKLEWELYPECIQLFAQGRLKTTKMSYVLENGKTVERTVVKIEK
jgi:phosphoribosylglycinamide formyltransferase-1